MALDLQYLYALEDFPGDEREHRRKLAQTGNRIIANARELLAAVNRALWIYGAEVDLTNGGANDQTAVTLLSGLPSGVSEIEVGYVAASMDLANQFGLVQLDGGAGFVTAGYEAGAQSQPVGVETRTDGFPLTRLAATAAADEVYGNLRLTLWSPSSNRWSASGKSRAGSTFHVFHGVVVLPGAVAALRATSPGGVAVFDNGSMIARYR